jgi:hypothetical protein
MNRSILLCCSIVRLANSKGTNSFLFSVARFAAASKSKTKLKGKSKEKQKVKSRKAAQKSGEIDDEDFDAEGTFESSLDAFNSSKNEVKSDATVIETVMPNDLKSTTVPAAPRDPNYPYIRKVPRHTKEKLKFANIHIFDTLDLMKKHSWAKFDETVKQLSLRNSPFLNLKLGQYSC